MFARVLPTAFFVLTLSACHRAPDEPRPAVPAPAPPPITLYRPPVVDSVVRIAAALAAQQDGGPPPALDTPTRLELHQPDGVDVIAVHTHTPRDAWVVAAVEPDRVSLGLAGAERAFAVANDARHPPDAISLARLVGAFAYYPWPVFDGSSWSETGLHFRPEGPAGRPQLVPRPGSTGRSLVFTYAIPDGQPGAGIHLAHFRITDSNYIIDEAPDPGRR